jgi:hypothetical protein
VSDMPFADFLDLAGVSCEDGSFVTAKTMRIVELIRAYDPGLDVEWIPRERRLADDDAIRVVDTRAKGLARTIMSFPDEAAFTADDGLSVLERIQLADHQLGNPVARMEARNYAAQVLQRKRHQEQRAERRDLMLHALKTPLSRWTFRRPDGELREIRDGKGVSLPAPKPKVIE